MRNWWIRFGCFLTGYNYGIVMNSSEVAVKAVKRYTAAMLIVCILWAFIGFMFTSRYLHANVLGAVFGAIIMITIVVQIERQIILSVDPSKWLLRARGLIALMMAFIGAIIIDQSIFKEDIELNKLSVIDQKINAILPSKTAELNKQITGLDSAINGKEAERLAIINDLNEHPTIKHTTSEVHPVPRQTTKQDPASGQMIPVQVIENRTSVTVADVPNPKQELLPALNHSIEELRSKKSEKEALLLNIRPKVETEIKSHIGFLDELNVMVSIITGSLIAGVIWLVWFFFLLGLELLVVISKSTEKPNDYEDTIKHQMAFQRQKLQAMAKLAEH